MALRIISKLIKIQANINNYSKGRLTMCTVYVAGVCLTMAGVCLTMAGICLTMAGLPLVLSAEPRFTAAGVRPSGICTGMLTVSVVVRALVNI